jgi:hypothetical protein
MIRLKDILNEVLTRSQRIKLKNELIPNGWDVDGWYDRRVGSIKLLRTNPTTKKLQIGVLFKDNTFKIVEK